MTEPTRLHALADGELDAREANALRESLKADPRAAAEVDAVLNLKEFLAKNSVRHTDEEAWKACVRRLDAIDRNRKAEHFVGRYAWAMCGVMFLMILSGRVAMRNVRGDTAPAAKANFFPTTSRSTDLSRRNARLYDAILGQAGRNLDPKEIQIFTPLTGNVNGIPAQRVPMRDREGDLVLTHVAGLMEFQDTEPLPTNSDLSFGIVEGVNGLVWHRNGETWVLSGNRPVEGLDQVAARLGAR